MRNLEEWNLYLASHEIDEMRVKRFDEMMSIVSDEAKNKMSHIVLNLRAIDGLGEKGAKALIIAMFDFFNLEEGTQKQAIVHGEWLLSEYPAR